MIRSNRDTGDANVIPLEHDGMLFCAYLSAVANKEDCIGAYVDRNGFPRRVRRNSLYGELVMAAVEQHAHTDGACPHANTINPKRRVFCPDCNSLVPATQVAQTLGD